MGVAQRPAQLGQPGRSRSAGGRRQAGGAGALSLVDGEVRTAPAVPVDVVDTVGAGDAFVAGHLAERVAGGSPAARLTLAVTTGAFTCLTRGDWEGLPRRAGLSLLTDLEPVRR